MTATHASGRHARLDVSLDGIRIGRTASDAARRHVVRTLEIEWDRVLGARLETTRKGRTIVRVLVADAPAIANHRDDPYAVKVSRADAETAASLVELIGHEVEVRRRWLEQAAADPMADDDGSERDPAVTGC